MLRKYIIVASLSSGYIAQPALSAPAPIYTRIAPLGTAATRYLQLTGGTVDGNTAIGWYGSAGDSTAEVAFRWTRAGGIEPLSSIGARRFNEPAGVSADGSVVVGGSRSGVVSPTVQAAITFRWQPDTGIVMVAPPTGILNSTGTGVSSDGLTLVGYATDKPGLSDYAAFRAAAGGATTNLPPIAPYLGTTAVGTDAHGARAAGTSWLQTATDLQRQATLWDQFGNPIALAPPGSSASEAAVMSASGAVVIRDFFTATQHRSWVWDQVLGFTQIPGMYNPTGISDDGNVVVGRADFSTNLNRPAIWSRQNGLQELAGVLFANGLDLATARAIQPTAIAVGSTIDNITLVGETPGDNGQLWGFVLTGVPTIPSPTAATLFTLAAATATRRRRTTR